MFEIRDGDIFRDNAPVLVNTVNCVGVMGKGIALGVKTRWPEVEAPYRAACMEKRLSPGKVLFTPTRDGKLIAHFPTKTHWRQPSRLEHIIDGLPALIAGLTERQIRLVALPPLGCTNGGLAFDTVKDEVSRHFSSHPSITARLYKPAPVRIVSDPFVPFGPYRGHRLSQHPTDALAHVAAHAWSGELKQAAERLLKARGSKA